MAARTRLEMATYLQKLGASHAASRMEELDRVITNPNASLVEKNAWAANLHDLIHTDGIVEGVRLRKTTPWLLQLLEIVRNVWVLAPLVLTWYGVSKAVDAFHTFLALPGNEEKYQNTSFVFLWQDGFGGELAKIQGVKLGDLAFYDFALLLILAILTLVVVFLSNAYNIARERQAENLRDELASVLSSSSIELARSAGSPSVGVNLQQLVAEMQQVRGLFASVVGQWQQDQKAIESLRTELGRAAGEMRTAADTLKATSTEFVNTNTELRRLCGEMASSANKMEASASSLTVSVADLKTQQAYLTGEAQKIVTGLGELSKKQDTMITNMGGVVGGLNNFKTGVETAINGLTSSMAGVSQSTRDAVDTLTVYKDETVKMVGMLAQISQYQANYYAALQQLNTEQQALVNDMKQIAQPSAQAMANLSSVMLGVWTEANKTVQLLGSVPARLQQSIDPVLQDHKMAAQSLSQAAQALNGAYGRRP
jgi:hypothetical protein